MKKLFPTIIIFALSILIASICLAQSSKKTSTIIIPPKTMQKKIPRSMAGDRGVYYLLGVTKTGNTVTTLHKRVGVDSTGYTICEIDFKRKMMRDIGYSEESPEKIKPSQSQWYDLVPGSSKYDLFEYVRSQKK